MYKYIVLFILTASFLIAGCTKKNDYVVTIHTAYGDMIAILYDETPKHKANFIKLAKAHFYDSLLFHRIMPGFLIQGGDPYSRHAPGYMMLGQGSPGYTIESEINPDLIHERGALAAARLDDNQNPMKASNGSQFYIVQGSVVPIEQLDVMKTNSANARKGYKIFSENPANKPAMDSLKIVLASGDGVAYQKKLYSLLPRIQKQTGIKIIKDYTPEMIKTYTTTGGAPDLDNDYTVFGKVIYGLDVLDSIAKQPTQLENRPVKNIYMGVTVDELSREAISKKYGYAYPAK